MKKRKLGADGPELSVVGFGTWALGGGGWKFGWGPQEDSLSMDAIRRGIELGINWIDTAPLYGFGHAEEIVGKALKDLKEKPLIATKFGITWDKRRRVTHSLKKDSIRRELEASLKRLKIDAVGLYQLHWPLPETDIDEAWLCASDLVREGKARYIGVSNCSVSQLERIKSIHKPASVQLPYSIISKYIEKDLIPYCLKEKIGVIAYGVLEKGLLTGAFSRGRVESLPMDDHRKRDPSFKGSELEKNIKTVAELKNEAVRAGRTCAQQAISRVLDNVSICSAIVGARSPGQVEENLKCF